MPPEIWPLEDILNLGTVWPSASGGRALVSEVLPEVQEQILQAMKMYDLLIVSLRDNGQCAPVRITTDRKRLRDGIHRVAIAQSLGWPTMAVTTQGASVWTSWDESPEGREYYQWWHSRLQGYTMEHVETLQESPGELAP